MKDISEQTNCESVECPVGWEPTTGKFLKGFTKWEFEYGFTCKQCQQNFIKPNKGNTDRCQKCSRYYLSNANHTICFNPYKEQFLSKDTIYSAAFGLSCLNIAFGLFALIIFMIYHNTPIVKSSDVLLTSIHLVTSVMTSTAFITLRHLKPSQLTCSLDAIIAGNYVHILHCNCSHEISQNLECFQFNA